MPSFDVVSELDNQEVVNAVDQARREITTRYDFRDTGSSVELSEQTITLKSVSEDRLNAVRQVLEEKFVRRKLSLKGLTFNKVEEAASATVRQTATLTSGINSDKAREMNKFIKKLGLKGMQSQTQGETIRVTSKKRDDLQSAMAALKETDFDIPVAFENFRD